MAKKTTDPKKKKTVQVPAGKGASRNVNISSAAGKRYQKAGQAMAIRKSGKKLLRSEKLAISKSFNPTKVRQSSSTVAKATKKAVSGMSKAISATPGRRKKKY